MQAARHWLHISIAECFGNFNDDYNGASPTQGFLELERCLNGRRRDAAGFSLLSKKTLRAWIVIGVRVPRHR